jgi:alkanesulfonate monooxygenase SsuD/methylene tetrahydromethanopterin reductase-like flavin-dependent oxidoreductase (luciferase family)
MKSLRRITAQNFGYNHDGNAEALQAGYELWKSWWASNGTNFSE